MLDPSVHIGPYAVIEAGVTVGPRTVIGAHAVLRSGAEIGADCAIDCHAVIAGPPQDRKFDPALVSGVRLGDGVIVREGVTIHRSTRAHGFTEIGAGAFLMANSHVAHDCQVGAGAVLANGVLLAGHVEIGPHAFLGGNAALHQFTRVGESAIVSGLTGISRDVPPFCMVAGRDDLIGLNLVALKRRGFDRAAIHLLKACYHAVFPANGGNPRALAAAALAGLPDGDNPARTFLAFFQSGRRGFVRRRNAPQADDSEV
jgi:UDP-N-acetylglucosamine acyltransferase